MIVIGWISVIVAVLAAVVFVVFKHPDVKALAGWTFLAAMVALMISLNGQTVSLGTHVGHGP